MMIKGAITGELPKQWTDMRIGKVMQARFNTVQTRILRLFMSTKNPEHNLVRISSFIVSVYGPLFLSAKHRCQAKDAPYILLEEIQNVKKFCNDEEREIVEPIIKHNAFYAHGENVLLSLLSSSLPEDH